MSLDRDSEPDRKRLRKCSPSNTGEYAKVFADHPTLYFEDGNVILRCGKTLFCIHRTLLAKHSEVFRGIFTAQPDGRPQELFRGCLFITLEDAPDDMESLLNTIYDGLHIDFLTSNANNLPVIAGLLRMSTKYKLDRTRATILDWLRLQWPSTLAKHDEKIASMFKRVRSSTEVPTTETVHPASIISLLRECGYNSSDLLAPLFYDLSTLITQFASPPTGHNLSSLSPADIERFIIGVNKLRSLHAACSQCPEYVVIHPAADKQQSILCQYELLRYWHNVAAPRLFDAKTQMSQPVEEWGEFCRVAKINGVAPLAGAGENAGMCRECKKAVLHHIDITRRKLWDSMSELFDLH